MQTDPEPSAGGAPLVSIVVVTWNSARHMPGLIAGLAAQECRDWELVVVDNGSEDGAPGQLAAAFPQVRIVENATNLGFCVANNQGMDLARGRHILLLNTDVILEPDYLAILTRALEEDPRLGWAAGKLVRPDGRIDSAGEVIKRNRRIVNRGEEEADMGQYDQREEVFGVSAAAALYRRSMLDDVRLAGEVFDSDYFAYLEDSDLNWRCQNAGWRCLYEPRARAVHARGHATGKPLFIRHHAYANRYLTLIKNEAVANFWRDLPELLLYEGYRLIRTVVAEQDLIGGYRLAFRLAARAWEKRRNLRPGVRVASAEVRRWFQPDDYLGRLRQGP